jgi:hypothetical protein
MGAHGRRDVTRARELDRGDCVEIESADLEHTFSLADSTAYRVTSPSPRAWSAREAPGVASVHSYSQPASLQLIAP